MGSEVIAKNLRRLREASGQTQEELARAAELTRIGYRNLENGQSTPRAATLQKLAAALSVGVEELVSPVRELRCVRFRAMKRLNGREQILAEVGRRLSDYDELEEILEERRSSSLAAAPLSKTSAIEAAQAVREMFGLRPDEPIRDICGLLERHGIKVLSVRRASPDFFGLSVGVEDGGPAVVVNTWERISVERWIFSAAHELGHLVLHLDAFDVSQQQEDKEEEREANQFASHFLMPAEVFTREWRGTFGMPFADRVLKVKRIFRVSYLTVLYRLQEMDVGVNVWKLFQNSYRQRYGCGVAKIEEPAALEKSDYRASFPESSRAKEPDVLSPTDFKEDRLWGLVRRAVEAGEISLSRGAEILNLPLSEMRQLRQTWMERL